MPAFEQVLDVHGVGVAVASSRFTSRAVGTMVRKLELGEHRRAVLREGPLVLVVKEADRVRIQAESCEDPRMPVGDRGVIAVEQQEAASRPGYPSPRQP